MDELIELGIKKRNGLVNLTWDELGGLYGKTGEQVRCKIKKYLKSKGELSGLYHKDRTNILFISDQHCPFNLPKEVFKDYVNKVDILVFGGDVQDCQAISKFTKKYRVPFVDEMVLTRLYIMDVIDYIKPQKVIFIKGNHEIRLINYLSDKITDDLLQLMPETSLDLIINNGFFKYNHENKSKTFYSPLVDIYKEKGIELIYDGDWWVQVGDVVFSHPKAFKSGILGTTEKAYLYFLQQGLNFNCLVTAHTHASAFSKYGKCFMYESGSLCSEPEYSNSGNLQRPQSQGFLFATLDNGHFDYDSSKLVIVNN